MINNYVLRQKQHLLQYVKPSSTMKSILIAPKPTRPFGSRAEKNDSPIVHLNLNNTTTTTTLSVAEPTEKEHYNKLFSNSRKLAIRNKCTIKSEVDRVKCVACDICEEKFPTNDSGDQRVLIKLETSDNISKSEFFDDFPLIVDTTKIALGSESQLNEKSVTLINLRQKNGTTLIFQKKANTQRHPRANNYQELESLVKRRSLQQWPDTGFSKFSDTNKSSRHSWFSSHSRSIEEVEVSLSYFDHIFLSFILPLNHNL